MPADTLIIGHSRQREQLLQDIRKNKLAHAYLFCGRARLGKLTVGKWFVEQILTHEKSAEEKKDIFHLIERNVHPDLITLDQLWIDDVCTDWNVIARSSNLNQQHRAKSKVKTDVIGIDDIRALQERLHETPQGGKMCCIIRSIERLHITAANALLKILEEPPPHVLFCFTTESPGSLPATIISRMRVIHFSHVQSEELEPLLKGIPEEDRILLLRIAQGSPGVIIRCLEDSSNLREYRQAHIDTKRFLESDSILERFQQLSEEIGKKQHAPLFMQHTFLHLQQDLRSENPDTAEKALSTLHSLFSLLHTLQSNTNKSLLAAHSALSIP